MKNDKAYYFSRVKFGQEKMILFIFNHISIRCKWCLKLK
ncbi:hypothetical protein L291_3084 [Acinetobacter guillouiae MSP4-18]|nr:hypothetical protein L291_3084 [Acinetobacter guillouiae MSP4-18]